LGGEVSSEEIRRILGGRINGRIMIVYKSALSERELQILANLLWALEKSRTVVLDDQTRGKIVRIERGNCRSADKRGGTIILRPRDLRGGKRGALLGLAEYLESVSIS
jgi:hypothetical protein